jgi:Holliday junction DNA helicase RuvB
VTIPLPPFTLVGATTRQGLLTGPMRGRFGHPLNLQFYTPDALFQILKANARQLKLPFDEPAIRELSRRSRGTPRVANRLLRRARDYAAVRGDDTSGTLTLDVTRKALDLEGIDERGLDEQDRAFLRAIIEVYSGGPVGIDAIAATLSEERDTLEEVIEPFLLQTGLLIRDRRGRIASKDAYEHLGLRYRAPAESTEASLYDNPRGAGS